MTREDVLQYARDTYGTEPEQLWEEYPAFLVLRNANSKKWYGLLMTLERATLGLEGDGTVDVLNVKGDPLEIADLWQEKGFLPAYHMSKTHWITILLAEVDREQVVDLLEKSYALVQPKVKRKAK